MDRMPAGSLSSCDTNPDARHRDMGASVDVRGRVLTTIARCTCRAMSPGPARRACKRAPRSPRGQGPRPAVDGGLDR